MERSINAKADAWAFRWANEKPGKYTVYVVFWSDTRWHSGFDAVVDDFGDLVRVN